MYLGNKGCRVASGSRHSSSPLLFSHFTLLPTPPRIFPLKLIVCGQAGKGGKQAPIHLGAQALEEEIPSSAPTGSAGSSAQRTLSLSLLYRGMKELAGQRGWGS